MSQIQTRKKSLSQSKERKPSREKKIIQNSPASKPSRKKSSQKNKYDIQYNAERFEKSVLGNIFGPGKSNVTCFCKKCHEEVKVKSMNTHLVSKKHQNKCSNEEKNELNTYFEESKAKKRKEKLPKGRQRRRKQQK